MYYYVTREIILNFNVYMLFFGLFNVAMFYALLYRAFYRNADKLYQQIISLVGFLIMYSHL